MWRYRVTPHRITVQGMIRRACFLQLVAECPDVRAPGPGGLTRLNLALTMTIIAHIRKIGGWIGPVLRHDPDCMIP